MYKKHYKKIGGYFTVEASMVMPAVIVLAGMLFYLGFYLYDCCAVTQDAYILAFRGSLHCGKGEEAVKKAVEEESRGKFGGKYINTAHFSSRAKVGKKAVTVEAKGILAATGWAFGAEWEAQRICPVDCIRKVRLAKKIMAELPDKG